MKNKNKNSILKSNQLKNLVNRFSKNYVIEEMERNLRQSKSLELLVNNIDDNSIIKTAIFPNETLQKVADSIKKSGLTNPLIVRPKKNYYEIVFGRKRLLACKQFKIQKVPVVVINVSDEEMLLMLLADNREQRDGNIVEMALILKELITKYNFNQRTLAEIVHQSRSQITNILRILNLPKHLIDDLSIGKLSYGHARAIASLPETEIENLVNKIYNERLSVRVVENLVKNYHSNNLNKNNNLTLIFNKFNCYIKESSNTVSIDFENQREKEEFLKYIKN